MMKNKLMMVVGVYRFLRGQINRSGNGLVLFLIFGLLLFGNEPARGSTPMTTSGMQKKLTELSDRVHSFEANWGRFQLGGYYSAKTSSGKKPEGFTTPNFEQQLGLALDTFIDSHHALAIRLSQQGFWGSPVFSTSFPLQIDEAFLKMEYPVSLNYLGRFKFSLGPVGLVSDFTTSPVEGLAMQRMFGKWFLAGVFSRFYVEHGLDFNQAISAQNYLAGRMSWSGVKDTFGLNLVPIGITGEKNISMDWSHEEDGARLTMELGGYCFQDGVMHPAILVAMWKELRPGNMIQIKGGYIAPGFRPSYSTLRHASGGYREWFGPDSMGVEMLWQKTLVPVRGRELVLENRGLCYLPVTAPYETNIRYQGKISLIKYFSPSNHLQAGTEFQNGPDSGKSQVFLSWNLQF